MSPEHLKDVGSCCALPGLTPEVARADAELRQIYQDALQRMIKVMADGLDGATESERDDKAIMLLALLTGGVLLGRAVPDADVAGQIARAIQTGATALAQPGGLSE